MANVNIVDKSKERDVTMGQFTCVTLTELQKVVNEGNSTTSCIDPVPTAFFKRVFDCVSIQVLYIRNTSLQIG